MNYLWDNFCHIVIASYCLRTFHFPSLYPSTFIIISYIQTQHWKGGDAPHAYQIKRLAVELLLIYFFIRLFRNFLYRLPEKIISWSLVAHFQSVKVRTATKKLNVTLPKVPERYNATINHLALGWLQLTLRKMGNQTTKTSVSVALAFPCLISC